MDTAQKIKCAQMDLLIELDRICKKNNIPYFLVGGTLIGAIRHNGFIPWDDDIDLAMMRKDFERFREVCAADLDEAYMLHDWSTDPASPHPFMKLKIKGTHYSEEVSAASKMDDAIFIDIFAYDNAPDGEFARKLHGLKRYWLKKFLLLRCDFDLGKGSMPKRVVYGVLKGISRLRSKEAWKRSFEKMEKKYNHRETEMVVNLGGAYSYERELKPRAMLEKLTTHRFENGMFSVPEDYDGYLRSSYGDYMQLPPEEQRVGVHHVQYIDFGDYTIRYGNGENRNG